MKSISKIAGILFLGLTTSACSDNSKTTVAQFKETKAECTPSAIPNAFIVHWKDGTTTVIRGQTREDFERNVFEPNKKFIAFAEQDHSIALSPLSLSPSYSPDFVADDWGQSTTETQTAWNAGLKGDGVIVAVVDSGVDITHPQLRDRVVRNSGEIESNGIDDDGNGYVDDVAGWDFEANSPYVGDAAGHGTHVAGIILADHDRGSVKGVAPKAMLLPLGFMTASGQGSIGNGIRAIQYAAQNGAKVINASWGGAPCSQALQQTIRDLENQNILFVAAAGNSGLDLDRTPEYPAAFINSNQLTVGASTIRGYTADFSNYSFKLVHLFAPGAQIASTYPQNRVVALSGTSMAAPFVSGAAALLFSAKPEARVGEIRNAILKSTSPGAFPATTRGQLNIRRALEALTDLN